MAITAKEVDTNGAAVSDGASSSAATLFLTFTASEDVTDFTNSDITCTNGVLSDFQTVSDSVYTATLTPSGLGSVTVSVGSADYADAASNANTDTPSFTYTAAAGL